MPFRFTLLLTASMPMAFILLMMGMSGMATYIIWALVVWIPVALLDAILFASGCVVAPPRE